jgi:hypothetical protein
VEATQVREMEPCGTTESYRKTNACCAQATLFGGTGESTFRSTATELAKRVLVIERVFRWAAQPRLQGTDRARTPSVLLWSATLGVPCKMDVCPGGAFRFCMRLLQGTDHWLQGVYREIRS